MPAFHRRSPIAFAHRGGRAHFRENTMGAFRHALEAGLTALETDAWLSQDGQVVLDHDGVIRSLLGFRRLPISSLRRHSLPRYIPTLAELLALAGPEVDISIDVKGSDMAAEVVKVFREHLPNSLTRLWLAHSGYRDSDWQLVAKWRALDSEIHLIDSTSLARMDLPVADYAARAQAAGIQVINLRAHEWRPDLVKLMHEHGLQCFAFRAQKVEVIQGLLAIGIDGVYSDHVDRLVQVLQPGDAC